MIGTDEAGNLRGHTHPPNFGRRESGCPRCVELASGAPPKTLPGFKTKAEREAEEVAALDAYCFSCPLWTASPCRHGKTVYTD